ncbi:MAG TPA: PfkB family carbohydrate kinase [Jatrophihabitans sp.]|nr:PfkB family carbohydrate kinase [Jatrophihabitans sp.]
MPTAPDLTLTAQDVPWQLVTEVPLLWITGTGVSAEPARSTQLEMLGRRGRPDSAAGRWTVLDLDWRPMFWASPAEAGEQYRRMLPEVSVVVGNRSEVEVAVGTGDPELAAHRLIEYGVELVLVKMGADGVLVATPGSITTVAPLRVEVVCGLGAGDAFGAAVVHGLLAGWAPVRIAEYANAAGAIVASRLACADAMPSMDEIAELVERRPVGDGAG